MFRRIVIVAAFLPVMIAVFLAMSIGVGMSAGKKDVPRMSKEELRGQLSSPDVVVIDARSGRDWRASEFKIAGAKREDPETIAWAGKYPKDTTIVIYCA